MYDVRRTGGTSPAPGIVLPAPAAYRHATEHHVLVAVLVDADDPVAAQVRAVALLLERTEGRRCGPFA
jgi:hypothetical protein